MGYTLHGHECLVHFEYCPPIFVVNYFTLHFWKQKKYCGVQQGPWIINLLNTLQVNSPKTMSWVTYYLCLGCTLVLKKVHQYLLSIINNTFIKRNEIIVCLPREEQTGVHQGPWIISLLKYLRSNLSKNYVLGYILLVFGLHVSSEEGPPIFFVNYQLHIY